MPDLQKQIDDLRATLDELLAVPRIRQHLDAHRNHLASLEAATRVAEEDKRRREAEDAKLRRAIERDPVVVVRVAPNALDGDGRPVTRVATPRGFDVVLRVDMTRRAVDRSGNTVPARHSMLHSDWLDMLKRDPDLRDALSAGHLQVDTPSVEDVIADVRRNGPLASAYRDAAQSPYNVRSYR